MSYDISGALIVTEIRTCIHGEAGCIWAKKPLNIFWHIQNRFLAAADWKLRWKRCPSKSYKKFKLNEQKIGVINDPPGQPAVPVGSDFRLIL